MAKLPQINAEDTKTIEAKMKTNKGTMTFHLFPELAPKTVENFVEHAKNGYYDGIIFHRVINNFMIQGGDPTGTGMGGESIWGEEFEDEFAPNLYNFKGALSMANSGPNTNGSQFFIVTADNVPENMLEQMKDAGYPEEVYSSYKNNGGTPWLDQRHTVFGQLVDGMDVTDAIESEKTGHADKPLEDIVIEGIEIVE